MRRSHSADSGPIVIEGFPGMGGVSSITSRYIIDFFGLKRMAVLDLDSMPPITIVKNRKHVPPVVVYGGMLPNGRKLAVIHSEIPAPENGIKRIASEIAEWASSINASLLLSAQGMLVEREEETGEISIYGTASSEKGEKMLEEAGIEIMEEGIITGIPGLLLSEGERHGIATIALLAESKSREIDAGSAALMVHAIDKLCLKSNMDCGPICTIAVGNESHRAQYEKRETAVRGAITGLVYR